ncbi:MAG: sulfurtransferase TusA family protein [Deltaproteobacteria bacterium]|nr:sulfurtransferase TusA family protein [Deltaproteobacteria bacterium]
MSHSPDRIEPNARLDTQGQSAAWAILCAERAVEELEPGQVLEVRVSDPQLAEDLPRILRRRGDILLAARQGDGEWQLYVRRGPARPERSAD